MTTRYGNSYRNPIQSKPDSDTESILESNHEMPVGDIRKTKKWIKNGKLHRDDDLPAVIWADGSQFWYKDGKCTGTATVIHATGSHKWFRDVLDIHLDRAPDVN